LKNREVLRGGKSGRKREMERRGKILDPVKKKGRRWAKAGLRSVKRDERGERYTTRKEGKPKGGGL